MSNMNDYFVLPNNLPPDITPPIPQSGGLSSLLGRGSTMLAGDGSPIFAGGWGAVGRAALPLGAGYLATAGINRVLPSTGAQGNVRQVLGDAATGAGVGGSVGLLGGPFAPLSVPTGAAIGGAVGGLYGLADTLFGSDDSKPDYKAELAKAATAHGLDPNQYTAAYDLLNSAGVDLKGNPVKDSKGISGQLALQILNDSATQKQYAVAQQQSMQQHASDQQFALAMQAQAQQFFTPYVNNIITSGQSQAALLKGQAAGLPEPYRQAFEAQAQQALAHSQSLAGAYAAQSAMMPSQYMYSQDIKRQQQLAQLQYQQSVINAQSAGGGSGGFSGITKALANQSAPAGS